MTCHSSALLVKWRLLSDSWRGWVALGGGPPFLFPEFSFDLFKSPFVDGPQAPAAHHPNCFRPQSEKLDSLAMINLLTLTHYRVRALFLAPIYDKPRC